MVFPCVCVCVYVCVYACFLTFYFYLSFKKSKNISPLSLYDDQHEIFDEDGRELPTDLGEGIVAALDKAAAREAE